MTVWIIKSETDDPERALEIVKDQRTKGYMAWIEDEHGKAIDEESLRKKLYLPNPPFARGAADYLLFLQRLWLLSVPFTRLVGGLTISFLCFVASLATWRYSPRSAAPYRAC
jgi:hypothetical protein